MPERSRPVFGHKQIMGQWCTVLLSNRLPLAVVRIHPEAAEAQSLALTLNQLLEASDMAETIVARRGER